jgi:diguanylate cyclase (GGDEF)-like protein
MDGTGRMRGELLYGTAVGAAGFVVAGAAATRLTGEHLGVVLTFVVAVALIGLLPIAVYSRDEHHTYHLEELVVVAALVAIPGVGAIVALTVGALVGRVLQALVPDPAPTDLHPVKVIFAGGKAGLATLPGVLLMTTVGDASQAAVLLAAAAGGLAYAVTDYLIVLGLGVMLRDPTVALSWPIAGGAGLAATAGGAVLAAAITTGLHPAIWLGLTLGILALLSRALVDRTVTAATLEGVLEVVDAIRGETEPARVEELLTDTAARLTYAEEAAVRERPPGTDEAGAPLDGVGPSRWLVTSRRRGTVDSFSASDRARLASLAVIGESALSSARRHAAATSRAQRCELTGLLNRSGARSRFGQLVSAATDAMVSVLFVDLDDFKQVNDTHGHRVGDEVLVEVARRLERCVRSRDVVARWSGDEFVVLLLDTGGEGEVLAERIEAQLRRPIADRDGLTISASVGVADGVAGEAGVDELVAAADQAMYAAKAVRRDEG